MQIRLQIATNNFLATWADANHLAMTSPSGFVRAVGSLIATGPVEPNFPYRVNVGGTHDEELAGAHSGEQLEPHHVCYSGQ